MVALILKSAPQALRCVAVAQRVIEELEASHVGDIAARSTSWRGLSGRRYLHTVYDFVMCPALVDAVVVLVKRGADGVAMPCQIGATESECASLNLAVIRQRGAALGISEVHVHFGATSDEARALAVCDLRAALFGSLAARPMHSGLSTNDTAAPMLRANSSVPRLAH